MNMSLLEYLGVRPSVRAVVQLANQSQLSKLERTLLMFLSKDGASSRLKDFSKLLTEQSSKGLLNLLEANAPSLTSCSSETTGSQLKRSNDAQTGPGQSGLSAL